ncbi:SusC/RagA family TonB-linked outer membrane protein [Puia dinghuensis]|uniref:SusC/RagA family TonB-linked outer membrane protein n=1 Tax=Puia dinghuensis TaxID=1792502 RepID=A0A8J2UJF6_9BACT|nr:SusC/RagA family TonB-linked outer membrane protein [Puia dinghuensis]GGB25446.1 SusC/RagA family TonB-linked outer membrane protein [Puia dinghuensis]
MQKTANGKAMPYPTLKLLITMKLTAILLCITLFRVNAEKANAQSISLDFNKTPIEKVFTAIEKQSGYSFLYGKRLLLTATPVTITVHNVTLETALKAIFENQPLTWQITDKQIIVSARPAPPAPPTQNNAAEPTPPPAVNGRILNENGEPVPGVTISLKSGKVVGITNEKGLFSLTNIPDDAILVFTSVNMETKEVHLYGRKDLAFTMTSKLSKLDEVVAIAYGTSTRRRNTGSISSVTSEEIAKQPVQNPLNALEGHIAGALITQNSGLPGSNVNVLIRGTSSLGNGTIPLYIIDGVPFNINDQSVPVTDALNSYGLHGANGQISPFSIINPSDIERIDVLKDADATAIYGTRAANGVVLITTKRGKAGKTKLDLNVYQGTGQVAHFLDMMNLQQYLALRHKAFANDGITPTAANAPDLFTYDSTRSTDWQHKYLGGNAGITDAQATVSGGDLRTRFLLSAAYHRETTIFPGSENDQRGTVRFNSEHNSLDRKFNATVSAMYSYDQSNLITTDLASAVFYLPPDYPLHNTNGSLFWDANFTNPESYFYAKYIGKTNNLLANTQLRYTILPGLDLKASLGFTKISLNQNTQTPVLAQNPLYGPVNKAQFGTVDQQSYTAEPQLVYNRNISHGHLTVLAGSTFQRSTNTTTTISASGYTNPNLLASIVGAASYSPYSIYTLYKYNSFFGRLTYAWKDKYIFNGNIRRDGSSRFGPNRRFGTFGSVGGAWVITNEKFAQNLTRTVSFAKLRASYGITGNDQIQDYQFLSAYSPGSAASVYQGVSILSPSPGNSYIHWETNKKLEFGADLGFLKDRLLLTVDYYRNRSDNQLSYLVLPFQTGYNSYVGNFPALLQNRGFEFEVNTKNIDSKNFTWRTSLNLTIPHNQLLKIDPSYFYASTYKLGHSIHQVQRFVYAGVNPATGAPVYKVGGKDSTTATPNYTTDRVLVGEGDPTWYGGMTNEFRYKNWDLSFFIQVTKQKGAIYPTALQSSYGNIPGTLSNVPAWWLTAGMWQQPGDNARSPKATTNTSVYAYMYSSNFSWGDNSFVKLRNVSFSYTFPENWISPMKMSNVRLYVQAQNVLTLTKNKIAYDPETGLATPPLRTVTFGINCSF